MRGIKGLVGVLAAALVLLAGSEGASAATLKASYQLQGDLVSEISGAPELTELGAGNRFEFDVINGVRRPVFAFQEGGGLSLSTAGLVDPSSHSVVMLFRLDEVSRYRRLLDFSGGASDNGLYNLFGRVALYHRGIAAISPGAVFGNSFVQLTLTNAAASGNSVKTTVYVNGVAMAIATTSDGFDLGSGTLRFFTDNATGVGANEESAGAIACVLVFDGTLTADEVREVAADSILCPAPRSAPGRPKAQKVSRPKAIRSRRSIVVDTGLTVRCPIGTASCAGSGRVDVAPTRRRAMAATIEHLGAVRFSVPAGEGGRVLVRLSGRGARALRRAGDLRVRASVEISVASGGRASARQTGRIEAPPSR